MGLDSPLPLPKFRLGADNFAGCPSRGKRSLTKTDRQKIVRSHGGIGQSVAKKDRQRIAKKDRQRIAKKDRQRIAKKDRAKCSKKMERAKCSKKTMDSKKIELNYYLKKL